MGPEVKLEKYLVYEFMSMVQLLLNKYTEHLAGWAEMFFFYEVVWVMIRIWDGCQRDCHYDDLHWIDSAYTKFHIKKDFKGGVLLCCK